MEKMSPQALREAAETSKAWPFEEARKLVARIDRCKQKEVIFETGYGPSGLPHLGTFGEVARTNMVRHAFSALVGDDIKTKLIAFSDDMDGLRKVPDNVPNHDLILPHLGKPLSQVPDPFGEYASFAEHNNARLRAFLDQFGFEYEFISSTECYKSGRFDKALLRMLDCFDEVQAVMLPSLRSERAATYSPFLPIHPRTGVVMQVPVLKRYPNSGAIRWRDPSTGEEFETPVTGGHCKLQWKPDWAMRWYALGVDYEMAGKDLIDSVKLSSRVARILGADPPVGFNYELFLDENGQKISKTKGNGLTIEQWLAYASPESLASFMFQKPTAAKRLYFDVIPRTVDDYLGFLEAYPHQAWRERLGNPVWHVHGGKPPKPEVLTHDGRLQATVSFAMLLNLAAVSNDENPLVLWGFLRRYYPSVSSETHPGLDSLVRYAVVYFRDFVAPKKRYREADDVERGVLQQLSSKLAQLPSDVSADEIQHALYDVGRPILRYQDHSVKGATAARPGVSNEFFNMIYAVLLGENRGPRLGSFIAIYGLDETRKLIDKALAGELVREG
ncbi:MAG: lysine--tRNA ligase [Hyphomicrobiales bacterium]|nr:lysine--tRNA ligase [Hyphomicrobiales bacterium]